MKRCLLSKHVLMFLILVVVLFHAVDVLAALDNSGIFDDVLKRYKDAAESWGTTITDHASWLFWTLVLISMVWTFGMLALSKADLGEFFAEFVRFTVFTGLFWWLLTNGPRFAGTIIESLEQIGSEATGLGAALKPSSIVDIGFNVFFKALDNTSFWSPIDSFIGVILSGIILVVLALIGVNMLLVLCSAWILMYGGVFFLGFGGSRWTSDIAINYYKTVLGVAASLLAMTLLIGVGKSFLDAYYARMSTGIDFKELSVMVIVVIILLYLVDKVPSLMSAITGAWVAGGIGQFGAGAAVGAFGLATAAAATGAAAVIGAGKSVGGGAQAIYAAYQKAQQNMGSGSGMFTGQTSGAGPGTEDQGGFARAMGSGVRLGADMGVRLAKGAGATAFNAYKKAASETIGGKVARAIKEQDSGKGSQEKEGPLFSDDSLSAAHPEVHEFVNKKRYNGE